MEAFQYTLDPKHVYTVASEEDLVSTLFQIEYTKHAQMETVLACSKECFQNWRQEDLAKTEKECLRSCFARSTALYDQFFSRTVRFNESLQKKKPQ